MKFKINKEVLLENLNNVGKALSNRNIVPIINGILFELSEDGLNLTATDNEITIKTFIDKSNLVEINSTGSLVIYGKFLLDIIRKLDNEDITIEEVDGCKAIISTSYSKYNLNCLNVNEYPVINLEESSSPIKLTAGNFKDIVNQTVFATSQQEAKAILKGINIKIIGNNLECVATDSYRLSKKTVKFNNIIENNVNIVIPARNINEFVKIIDDDNETVELHTFSSKVLLKYKNINFQSSILNGNYPNTDSLLPASFEYIFKLDTNAFYNIMDRASILAAAKEKNIVSLEVKGDKLLLTSSSPEIGKIEEVMNIEVIKGNDIKISFSVKHMMEAIKSFNSKEVNLYLNGEIKPIIVKEDDNGDLLQLIMPIKTY